MCLWWASAMSRCGDLLTRGGGQAMVRDAHLVGAVRILKLLHGPLQAI